MLPPDESDISERSRKFYDGTYTLRSKGFVDEVGVYRAFDCCDPAARAPTPLPPVFPGDGQLGGEYSADIGARRKLTESPAQFTFASESWGGTPITILQSDLFLGHDDRERLLGKIEGIQLAIRQQGTELSLAGCYRLCGIPCPGVIGSTAIMPHEQETMPLQDVSTAKAPVKDISVSPLSDCPSDLSDWKDGKKSKGTHQATESKVQVQEESRAKRATRGVAQKVVRKTPKKATAGPALVSRAPAGGRSRRQSARQAKSFILN